MLIEQTILEYLISELNFDDVYVEIPRPIPDVFLVIRVMDRGKENQINEVTIEVMTYAESKLQAATLDSLVRQAMEDANENLDLSCRFGGGNDAPDTELKLPRYRSYFNLYF